MMTGLQPTSDRHNVTRANVYKRYEALTSELSELIKPKSWILLLRKVLIARPVKIILLVVLSISVVMMITSNVNIEWKVRMKETHLEEKKTNFENKENWLLVAKPRSSIEYKREDDPESPANWLLLNRHADNHGKQIEKNILKPVTG
ncbi:hypothetical protein LSH36_291g09017 [Paralvinella palmiformis]|uniref:Uncharacterized protein n=1 Tax=Paralvinella palmiformis TaxID=53620 RepID=A0AAD9JJJ7_9ANNE|nr:hypothetical protein LSH36_291g09017 [Paralvinella palmiformis]